MVSRLRASDIAVIKSGLHEELTRVANTAAEVCIQLHDDFFDPTIEPAPEVASAVRLELGPKPEQAVASVVRPTPEPDLEQLSRREQACAVAESVAVGAPSQRDG
jgi:hypothetical protein